MAEALKKGIGARYLLPMVAAYAATAAVLGLDQTSLLTSIARHVVAAGLAGVLILVFQDFLPRRAKEVLIYWRIRNCLPGCRAFSEIAPKDQRIDQAKLASFLPPQPMTPAEQNVLWYRWLKEVENDASISDNHHRLLALRECTVMALALAMVSPFLSFLPAQNWLGAFDLSALCTLVYLMMMLATRNAANRLVGNVIALKVAKSAP